MSVITVWRPSPPSPFRRLAAGLEHSLHHLLPPRLLSRRQHRWLHRFTHARRPRARAVGAFAAGLTAFGAMAVGALSIGAFAVGSLVVGRMGIGRLELGRLKIKRLEVEQYTPAGVAPLNP